nr:hypothetical protein [Phenylobacterium sp. J367]
MPNRARQPGGAFSTASSAAPAPLAAQAEALAEAQDAEQERREPAGHLVGRQEGDGDRRAAHKEQAGHERRLPADAVAEVAEEGRADRPGEEGEREGAVGQHELGRARGRREEQLAEHQRRGRGVDVEVVELDRRPDEARRQDPSVRRPARNCCGHVFPLSGWV